MKGSQKNTIRTLMKDTLLQLLSAKDFHKITVSELCSHTGINRSTFYSYYENIYSLVEEIENEVIGRMPLLFYSGPADRNEILKHAEFIEKNYKTIALLVQNGFFTEAAINKFMEYYSEHKLPRQKEREENQALFHFICTYVIGGLSQSLVYWSQNRQELSSQQAALLLLELSKSAIRIRERYESMKNI